MSTIKKKIDAAFREARLARNERAKNVISMIKTTVLLELKSGSDVADDDALWLKNIAAYAKKVSKAIPEFAAIGERGAEALDEAHYELEFCQQFLPSKLDELATEALVRQVAKDNGIDSPKMMGKMMGLLMKDHRDDLDGDLARKLVQKVLSE